MTVRITFGTADLTLPLAYGHAVQGLIYSLLRRDPVWSERLHDMGRGSGETEKKKYKLFVFKPLSGKYRIDGKQIIFPDSVTLEFRSADPYTAGLISGACAEGAELELNGQRVTVLRKETREAPVFSGGTIFAHLVTAHRTDGEGHTFYLSPGDADFCRAVEANASRKWAGARGDAPFDFSFAAVPDASFRRTVTQFKGIYVTAWSGRFLVSGSPEVLRFLYDTGLGDRNSQGFGAFDLTE